MARDRAKAPGGPWHTPDTAPDGAEAPPHTVGEVARLAHVSVRTLHHYDAIGLLEPAMRGENGYRRYGPDDLRRLQRILAYRELGFDLRAIAAMLEDPEHDELSHLRRQRTLLEARRQRLDGMLRALDATMEARQMGIDLDPKDMLEAFGDFDPTEHAAEAEARWGETDAYRESRRRTRRYDKEAWRQIRREAGAIEARLADLRAAGVPAGDPRTMDAAEAHRQHLTRWFYACGKPMHLGLADLYEADPRFAKHYDDRAPGLAAYVAAAIRANAARD